MLRFGQHMSKRIAEHLTQNEAILLLGHCERRTLKGLRDFCILKLMIVAGLRRAEITGLMRCSLVSQDQKINLYVHGKGKRWRKIPIKNLELLESLKKYFKRVGNFEKPNEPMFYKLRYFRPEGPLPITAETIRRVVEKYAKLAVPSKRITPHSLRHTFCTLTLRAGADLSTVQHLAGHQSIATTSRYLHTTEELMEKAVAGLDF